MTYYDFKGRAYSFIGCNPQYTLLECQKTHDKIIIATQHLHLSFYRDTI